MGDPGEQAAQTRRRLVLADDHEDVLSEIRLLLETEFNVESAVREGAALIDAVCEFRPDAVVSDIQLPRLSGIEAGHEILRRGWCKAVILLTMYDEPRLVKNAIDAGIRGYVLKVDAGEELVAAIECVLEGGTYFSRGVATNVARRPAVLGRPHAPFSGGPQTV